VKSEVPSPPLVRSPLWWLALAVGTALRAVGLRNQIPLDDEVHVLRAVLELGFPEVLWRYRPADHCLPLTAWLRAWMELGVPPAEWMLRLPILACGVALLVLVSRWLAPRLGFRTAVATTWILALAPPAIYYSRLMRPYMPAALAGCAAAGLFLRWWQTASTVESPRPRLPRRRRRRSWSPAQTDARNTDSPDEPRDLMPETGDPNDVRSRRPQ
jgi:predicted membrane-bound mannosyltransferase